MNADCVNGWLWRATNISRWLTKPARDTYERTAKFPYSKPTAVTSPVHVPGLDPEPAAPISEQLAKALKDRDAAVANGQDKLARILQDKVDKLQREIA